MVDHCTTDLENADARLGWTGPKPNLFIVGKDLAEEDEQFNPTRWQLIG